MAVANKDGSKKKVTATIKMSYLLYDIMNETFLRGRTLQNRENHKEIASMFASEDGENRDKILRSIKKAWGEVQSELADYLNENGSNTNNRLTESDATTDLVLNLEMPSNFNEAATMGLGQSVHDYIKNITIAEWYIVTNKGDADDYLGMAERSLGSIRVNSSKRARPQRPDD
ncbi:MAG: hypothetical protein J1D77_03695 [Muribaculaceae bacterium]|nr:hypothetical protein [Muribaculaceae bacterium]